MITLTTPHQINTLLGGSAPVGYNKFVLSPFTMHPHPTNRFIQGSVKLSSTTSPDMPDINGTFRIDLGAGTLVLEIEPISFFRRIVLSAGQITSVQTIINNAQNALEAGLVSLGVVSGTQATGA